MMADEATHVGDAETQSNRTIPTDELEDDVEDIKGCLVLRIVDLTALDDADQPERESC